MCNGLGRRTRLRHALGDVVAGQRAVAGDEVGRVLGHRLEHRLADLHRHRMGGRLHAIGARMAGTAFNGVELDLDALSDQLEHLLGLAADLLHPAVARDVVADPAQGLLEVGLQQPVLVAGDEVFKGVPHRVLHKPHVLLVRKHQRQFLLEHQRATRDGRQDGEAVSGIGRQHGDIGRLVLLDAVQVTQLQLGHAAAGFLLDDHIGDRVVFQHLEQVEADAGFVVVDIAGGEDGHLARCALAIADDLSLRLGRAPAETLGGQRGQPGLGVHAELAVHQPPSELGAVQRVDRLHHDRNAGELAMHIRRREEALAGTHLAAAELDRLGAQHGVREVQVPRMRRHIGALGQVAQVTQIALVDDLPEVGLVHAIQLAGLARIDQVEQGREALTQADAAPAAVADVEDALHLVEAGRFVVEARALPVQRVPRGRFEIAFASHHQKGPLAAALAQGVSRPARQAPSGSGWHGSARPWPASRTSPQSRQSPHRAPSWPCQGTCRCTRGFRRRPRPSGCRAWHQSAGRWPGHPRPPETPGARVHARSRPRRWSGTARPHRSGLRCRPCLRSRGSGGWPETRPQRRPSGSARSCFLSSSSQSPVEGG
mmetsp:Transcript_44686/g.105143  ORF Transcript_44686/g.105143 Transcript_44686/m.105143 type:complete len:598 (-) Transcript_44686:3554-5347(-)